MKTEVKIDQNSGKLLIIVAVIGGVGAGGALGILANRIYNMRCRNCVRNQKDGGLWKRKK